MFEESICELKFVIQELHRLSTIQRPTGDNTIRRRTSNNPENDIHLWCRENPDDIRCRGRCRATPFAPECRNGEQEGPQTHHFCRENPDDNRCSERCRATPFALDCQNGEPGFPTHPWCRMHPNDEQCRKCMHSPFSPTCPAWESMEPLSPIG